MAFLLPENSIYFETLTYLVGRYTEAGLILHWMEETEYVFLLDSIGFDRKASEKPVITIMQLAVPFFILTAGMLLGTICFLIELWLKQKKLSIN